MKQSRSHPSPFQTIKIHPHKHSKIFLTECLFIQEKILQIKRIFWPLSNKILYEYVIVYGHYPPLQIAKTFKACKGQKCHNTAIYSQFQMYLWGLCLYTWLQCFCPQIFYLFTKYYFKLSFHHSKKVDLKDRSVQEPYLSSMYLTIGLIAFCNWTQRNM